VDASVLAPLLLTVGGKLVYALRKIEFNILELTIYEVCNAFWKECTKLGRLSVDEVIEACDLMASLIKFMKVWSISEIGTVTIQRIAIDTNITFYDASYIHLARKLNFPIATEDSDIISVAPKYNVELLRLKDTLNLMEKI